MQWTIELDATAAKAINKLDKPIRERIRRFLKALAINDNPRSQGKALSGRHAGLWRYRIGDYRIICNIQDEKIIILVLAIGHRKDVYR
jgi:mRNA interferase RelE/StbE